MSKKAASPSPYEYKHNVDNCACGTCYKARVDSGTHDAYMKRCREASKAACARLSVKPQESYQPAGGSTGHPDFAKTLFAAMGTPHDSTCAHGLRFYSCMPCSH